MAVTANYGNKTATRQRHIAIFPRKSTNGNIVGYQNYTSLNESRITTTTFTKIGTGRKLGDYVPVSKNGADFSGGNFNLNFYNKGSAPRKVNQDAWFTAAEPTAEAAGALKDFGTKNVTFYWFVDSKGEKTGWYLTADNKRHNYPMGDYPLNEGDGFLMVVTDDHGTEGDSAGVQLTHSGEVEKDGITIKAVNESLLTGNVTPATITLGEITPVSLGGADFSGGNFNLNFYNKGSAPRKVNDDPWFTAAEPTAEAAGALKDFGTKNVTFYWFVDSKGEKTGWYLTADNKRHNYPMGDYPIAAGDGFLMVVTDDHGTEGEDAGVKIVLPSPIEE